MSVKVLDILKDKFDLNKKDSFRETEIILYERILNKDGFFVSTTLHGTQGATAGNYGVFFIAHKGCEVVAVRESHEAAGTDAGAVTLDIEKLPSGTAPGSGTAITSSGFNLKSTANTPVSKTSIDLTSKTLDPGDRLALKLTGTPTAVDGVTVTIYLKRRGKGHYN